MKVHSLFQSINGEVCGAHQGSLCTFVRLFGCNCRCGYCDSKFSYGDNPFTEMRVRDIVKVVSELGCKNVTITGGEPLIQKGTPNLIRELLYRDFKVSVETNGTIFIPNIERASWVADYKLPSSGCEWQMDFKNYRNLIHNDFVKFVITNREDFDRAVEVISLIEVYVLGSIPKFAFSPAFGEGPQNTLVEWMIKNPMLQSIGAIYNLQIHKILKVK